MQNRYAGDIGDFVKLALLRTLGGGSRTGVAWYLFPDEAHNADGRHTSYLASPERWRHLDPDLFDGLTKLTTGVRTVRALQPLLGNNTIHADEPLAMGSLPSRERCAHRTGWFERILYTLRNCGLVFADPDNGIVDDDPRRRRQPTFGKHIPLQELLDLGQGRTAVIYHHNSRFKGGHSAEVEHWMRQIDRPTIAVRANAYSCRTFFIVNPDTDITERAEEFCDRWKDHRVWLHRPEAT